MRNVKPFTILISSICCALASLGWQLATDHSQERIANRISDNLSKALHALEIESARILDSSQPVKWSELTGSHFLMDSLQVIAWSDHEFLPDVRQMRTDFKLKLIRNSSGDFLLRKQISGPSGFLISVLPLYKKYPIVNRYLTPQINPLIFEKFNVRILDPLATDGLKINFEGQTLFVIDMLDSNGKDMISLSLALLALIFFILSVIHFLRRLHKQRKYQTVFLLAASIFILLRLVMLQLNFPGSWYETKIFSPQAFASSSFNASMGDLFLNALVVMMLCGYVLLTYSKWPIIKRILKTRTIIRWACTLLFLLLSIFSFLYPFLFIETIFNNSSISLDITQSLSFDVIRVLAFISITFGVISSFFFTHIFIRIAKALSPMYWRFSVALLVASVLFVSYFKIESRDYWITLAVALPFILLVYFTKISSSLNRITYVTFLYLFFATAAFATQGALSIQRFIIEKRVDSQFKFASGYLIDRDVLAEYLLNESIRKIPGDAFIQTRLASPFLSKSAVRQKVKQIYLNSYFDRYDVKIYLYNSSKEPYDDQTQVSLSVLESELSNSTNETEYTGLYFVRSQGVKTGKRYFTTIPIIRFEQIIGYVALDLSLKRIIPQNVYPELLVDNRFGEYFENRDKSFAFISNNGIISSFGNFNYERDFDFGLLKDPVFYEMGIEEGGFIHVGIEDDSNRVAVVTSMDYPSFYVLTNFSFLFIVGMFVVGIGLLMYGFFVWARGGKINYAARIQLYIYMAFVIPLVVVTLTTLNRITRSAENQLNQDFNNRSSTIGENMEPVLTNYWNDPVLNLEELENQLVEIARFSNIDLSVYDPSGRILVTSQPGILENQLTSGLMDRNAWEKIFDEGDNSLIVNENIGSLIFNNSYVALKSTESGSKIGVLSAPFFESRLSLETNQINVLANVLTVFTLIFILFSVLSFFIVDLLTFPLRFITRTLSRTTLTGNNEPLQWKSKDEIGLMVDEYNRMLRNLEQSKIELSRSQKESAWREIARQVAHEIKNPLTPMKLTLQQMESIIMRDGLDKEKSKQSIKTLLTQVDILNEIASSFSTFARMPAPILQKIDLTAVIRKSVDLHSNYETGTVRFEDVHESVFIMADEQLLHRIISNIILNALQSSSKREINVDIKINLQSNLVDLMIKDNGDGIDLDLQERIFLPYFSTKKSGSGLGLAIAKQGIEQSGGAIWFETVPEGGTIFTIRFPLA
jgi:two-component system nitrogen regulation sensor histidine kinase NtrY